MSERQKVERDFWDKVRETMGKVPFLRDAIAMYFCMLDEKTPLWVKTMVVSALAYFILPVDAIPDVLAGLGYTDDAAIIAGTLKMISDHVTEEHQRRARKALIGK